MILARTASLLSRSSGRRTVAASLLNTNARAKTMSRHEKSFSFSGTSDLSCDQKRNIVPLDPFQSNVGVSTCFNPARQLSTAASAAYDQSVDTFPSLIIGANGNIEPQGSFAEAQAQVSPCNELIC